MILIIEYWMKMWTRLSVIANLVTERMYLLTVILTCSNYMDIFYNRYNNMQELDKWIHIVLKFVSFHPLEMWKINFFKYLTKSSKINIYLSIRKLLIILTMSTILFKSICLIPIERARKQPVRPMPALQCTRAGPLIRPSSNFWSLSTSFMSSIRASGFSGKLWSGHDVYQ